MNDTKRRIKLCVMMLVIPAFILCWEGCKSGKLELGGAYRPSSTNAAGIVVDAAAPDYAFFVADLAFSTAYSAVDAALTFEHNNRKLLWGVSPEIKHTLDKIRPVAWSTVQRYARARSAYLSSPTPAGLSTLQNLLSEIQKIAASAQAALPKATVENEIDHRVRFLAKYPMPVYPGLQTTNLVYWMPGFQAKGN